MNLLLKTIADHAKGVLDICVPPCCPVCKRLWHGKDLCPPCSQQVMLLRPPLCPRCRLPLAIGPSRHICPDVDFSACDYVFSAGNYQSPLGMLIRSFKYADNGAALEAASSFIRKALDTHSAAIECCDLVTWVPLHPLKYMARGFNQAYEIARLTARITGLPLAGVLLKNTWTRSQMTLHKSKRRKDSRHIFTVRGKTSLSGKKILLVDDITTTGSTLNACAKVSKEAGARYVCAFTVVRTLPYMLKEPSTV